MGEDEKLLKQGNTSTVDVRSPDLKIHPLYAKARGYYVILKPGDTLFIPHGMWHFVYALTPSLSVNFWMEFPSDKVQ